MDTNELVTRLRGIDLDAALNHRTPDAYALWALWCDLWPDEVARGDRPKAERLDYIDAHLSGHPSPEPLYEWVVGVLVHHLSRDRQLVTWTVDLSMSGKRYGEGIRLRTNIAAYTYLGLRQQPDLFTPGDLAEGWSVRPRGKVRTSKEALWVRLTRGVLDERSDKMRHHLRHPKLIDPWTPSKRQATLDELWGCDLVSLAS